MSKIEPHVVEAAAIEAWNTLFDNDPLKDIKLTRQNEPAIYEAHLKLVRALLETGCDMQKAVRIASDGRYGFDEYFDSGKVWCNRLAAFLKPWAAKNGIK